MSAANRARARRLARQYLNRTLPNETELLEDPMPMTISEKILAAYPSQNKVRPGELIEAKLSFVWGSGRITNHSQGQTYQAQAIPEFMRSLLNAGGLIPYIQQKLQQEENLA